MRELIGHLRPAHFEDRRLTDTTPGGHRRLRVAQRLPGRVHLGGDFPAQRGARDPAHHALPRPPGGAHERPPPRPRDAGHGPLPRRGGRHDPRRDRRRRRVRPRRGAAAPAGRAAAALRARRHARARPDAGRDVRPSPAPPGRARPSGGLSCPAGGGPRRRDRGRWRLTPASRSRSAASRCPRPCRRARRLGDRRGPRRREPPAGGRRRRGRGAGRGARGRCPGGRLRGGPAGGDGRKVAWRAGLTHLQVHRGRPPPRPAGASGLPRDRGRPRGRTRPRSRSAPTARAPGRALGTCSNAAVPGRHGGSGPPPSTGKLPERAPAGAPVRLGRRPPPRQRGRGPRAPPAPRWWTCRAAVESSPGRKDPELVRAFVEAVAAAGRVPV